MISHEALLASQETEQWDDTYSYARGGILEMLMILIQLLPILCHVTRAVPLLVTTFRLIIQMADVDSSGISTFISGVPWLLTGSKRYKLKSLSLLIYSQLFIVVNKAWEK